MPYAILGDATQSFNAEIELDGLLHGESARIILAISVNDTLRTGMRKLAVVIALTAFAGIAGVQAQTYPSRSITIVVPFPPGGSTDVAARTMADRMRPLLGQSIIIENVGGAGGSIAVGRVARAAPDG